ncbi:alpha/beta hydrolase [Pseudomonas gingeri]|uniref:Alpha/beta fold hydrolase n=1 Tax=Pseudomonas gingeri TaxID=117681 RepID=A0A7Y7YH76_9PSED|nr:alpha/beta fold hydrolase [Pseudomonas gingeri]NWB31331.1 alpha/beta fold hydrolase [Pseudomonas gingeri]NWC35804.1 alpha/beta fold hydrolase [Pseudomonas gingeri]NWD06316.1 alpha/beta fold hydrolase [Pseudomonas gingeri]NWE32845.1 alpha/beta fold hydrolase [Pseudomonas gingeri]NWE60458.1 alpha/beta fold hydrolase [Pseudomonas gingeri]
MSIITCNEFMIPSDTPGIELYVRNKHRADLATWSGEKTLLFVAGSTYPASSTFDLALDGQSWMDQLAQQGYDTYLVDVRGYGRSSKPPEMLQPAGDNPPVVRAPVATSDVAAAVAFVRQRRGVSRINLIGWSWGTSLMARYTAEHNEAVVKLVLVAPQWLRETPSLADNGGTLGAYRIVKRTEAKARWLNGVPQERQTAVLPEAWFEAWADATFGPGETQLKAPNGTVQDSREFWTAGRPLYDPSLIRVPVLIVHADGDRDCPLELSRAVFSKLTQAAYRRWVEIGEGTHSLFMERNRWQVFGAVQAFLDERAPYQASPANALSVSPSIR